MIRKIKVYYYFEEEDAKAFREILKDNGMTQADFAKEYDISDAYVSAIILGQRACPDFIHVILRRGVLIDAFQEAHLRVQRKKSV